MFREKSDWGMDLGKVIKAFEAICSQRGLNDSIQRSTNVNCRDLLADLGKKRQSPNDWHIPLFESLKCGAPRVISSSMDALSDLYSFGLLGVCYPDEKVPILVSIGGILEGYTKEILMGVLVQITRFVMGVIIGE